MRLLIAIHGRDVKRALFLALRGIEGTEIVGAATTTAELLSLCRALAPDLVVVEAGLPGHPLRELVPAIAGMTPDCRVLILDPLARHHAEIAGRDVEVFTDVEVLAAECAS